MNDWIIHDGLICDGSGAEPFRGDVLIQDGKIAAVSPDPLPREALLHNGAQVLDAQNYIVTPGLIDLHVHVYDGMNQHSLSPSQIGLNHGVTTLLDTGSAGAMNFGTFAKYVIPAARENIFALLNISWFGVQGDPNLAPFIGDLHDAAHFNVPFAMERIREYSEHIVGVKVRLTRHLADDDEAKERAAFDAVLQLRDECGLPLMVHHVMSKIPLQEVLSQLRAGDILTHFYHAKGGGGFDENGAPFDFMYEARARGVLFDVGHGSGCFSWRVAEAACGHHGFWPDTISSDLHIFNLNGPVFDLPTTMSKFLHLGMPLEKVIAAASTQAAAAMNQPQLGRLAAGANADITLLELERGAFPLIDSENETRTATQKLTARAVFKNGERFDCAIN